MTTSIGGTAGITFPDASTQSNSQVGMKNRIIDGGFTINQRVYVSGTSLSSGTYGHDRWKGGASAGTYTFTQGALGVNTTITITAGSIIQVIEGCNLPEGGTYVLSWTGTAQGRLNDGTYGSSGTVTVTGWVAGTNLNVEFSTGTCGGVQLEKGSTATSFDYRPFGTELALCQRYLPAFIAGNNSFFGSALNSTQQYVSVNFPVQTRVAPTGLSISSASHFTVGDYISTAGPCTSMSLSVAGINNASVIANIASGLTQARPGNMLANTASAILLFTGCEL